MENETDKKPETTAVATTDKSAGLTQGGAFGSVANFEAVQRMARMFAESDLVPDAYKGKLGNCVIAMEMANRLGANILSVMQNMYIVYGKPAWSSQFLISCINASGKFSPLRYTETGSRADDTWGCIAWALDKSGENLKGPEVTLAMAKAEGWYSKNGSKWKTMPELMLRYRAATLFARLFAPELTMGMSTEDEVIDITPVVTEAQPSKALDMLRSAAPAKPADSNPDLEAAKAATPPAPGKEPARPDPLMDAIKALESVNVPADLAEGYLRQAGKIGMTVKLKNAPKPVLLGIAADPVAFGKLVSAWEAGREGKAQSTEIE